MTARMAHHLRTTVLMTRAFCLQDPKILCRPILYSSCTQLKTGQLLIPRGCRRRDDGWRQKYTVRRGPTTKRHRLVKARNHHVGRRRDAAMHSTIMINGSNIAAASHLTASQRRQVPLRQRGELNPRLHRSVDFRFIPCYPVRCCIVSRL